MNALWVMHSVGSRMSCSPPLEHSTNRARSADERSGNTCHDHGTEITYVTVDCRDPRRLAAFWSEALDWEVAYVAETARTAGPSKLVADSSSLIDNAEGRSHGRTDHPASVEAR